MLNDFKNLEFEQKAHKYRLEGRVLPSVSSLVSNFYKPFDTSIAKYSAIKHNTTESKIKAKWRRINRQAIKKGNRVHDFAERYAISIKTGVSQPNIIPTLKDELNIVKFFFDKSQYDIVAVEQRLFSKKFGFAGTCDLIIKHKRSNKYILVDWKTNKNIYKNYKGQKLYKPFNNYLDQPLTHYFIQLSLYQLCLEEAGYQVSERWIYWTTEGKLIKAPNLVNKLKKHYGK